MRAARACALVNAAAALAALASATRRASMHCWEALGVREMAAAGKRALPLRTNSRSFASSARCVLVCLGCSVGASCASRRVRDDAGTSAQKRIA
jgi:hypothetical protein